jgi:3-oxoacyl-[acyl-carrier protein] reductase
MPAEIGATRRPAPLRELTGYSVLCNTSLNFSRGFINRTSELAVFPSMSLEWDHSMTADSYRGVEYHLDGRVVLVTGVSRRVGIGAGIARRLASEGAHLILQGWSAYDSEQPWGEDVEGVRELVEELRAQGTKVTAVRADFADPAAPAAVMTAAVEAFGHVDALVVNHARGVSATLEEIDAAEIDLSFAVNARASVLLVKEFAAQHDGRSGGRVVLFTSGQHLGPMPGELPYVISKGAIQQMTASLARHLAPRGITVNCINPGPTDTGWPDEAVTEQVIEMMPQSRWGMPDDAARLIAWLLSPDAQWVCGQTLNSEGGETSGGQPTGASVDRQDPIRPATAPLTVGRQQAESVRRRRTQPTGTHPCSATDGSRSKLGGFGRGLSGEQSADLVTDQFRLTSVLPVRRSRQPPLGVQRQVQGGASHRHATLGGHQSHRNSGSVSSKNRAHSAQAGMKSPGP